MEKMWLVWDSTNGETVGSTYVTCKNDAIYGALHYKKRHPTHEVYIFECMGKMVPITVPSWQYKEI